MQRHDTTNKTDLPSADADAGRYGKPQNA